METFSRGQQFVVLLIIFGMTLLYFHSINQPASFPPLHQGEGRGEGVLSTANLRRAKPTLQSEGTKKDNDSSFIPHPSSLPLTKLSGAQLLTLNKPVNLNTATARDLEAIPGIGTKTAERIVAHRKEHGRFAKIEDIMKVPGIKEKRFEKIKRYLAVE